MLYLAYQAQSDLSNPARLMARSALGLLATRPQAWDYRQFRSVAAAYELISRAGLTHERPPYRIDHVMVGNQQIAVREEAAFSTPFGTLLHFDKDCDRKQPKVLLVAPLSGHFATLLRNTVQTLLAEHDVYITDWHNARDVSLEAGRFGFEDYVRHVIRFLEELGPGANVVAVCQPAVQVLAAVAVMAEQNNPAQPATMTLMAGPSIPGSIRPKSTNLQPPSRSRGSSAI